MSNEWKEIGASKRYHREEGVALFVSNEGVTADGVFDGNFDGGDVTVPWSEVLKHAPDDAIRKEVYNRTDLWGEFH
jgi:hypothetical protein